MLIRLNHIYFLIRLGPMKHLMEVRKDMIAQGMKPYLFLLTIPRREI